MEEHLPQGLTESEHLFIIGGHLRHEVIYVVAMTDHLANKEKGRSPWRVV